MKFLALKNWLWRDANGKLVHLRGRSSVVESNEDLSRLERGTLFRKIEEADKDYAEEKPVQPKKAEPKIEAKPKQVARPRPVVKLPQKK